MAGGKGLLISEWTDEKYVSLSCFWLLILSTVSHHQLLASRAQWRQQGGRRGSGAVQGREGEAEAVPGASRQAQRTGMAS